MSLKRIDQMNLTDLRGELAKRIKINEEAVLEDKRKLALLDGLILEFTGRQKTLDLLAANTVEVGPTNHAETLGYANMRMVDAILDVLNRNNGRPINIRGIAERLVQGGYQPKGKNFMVTLRNALQRFADKEDSKVKRTDESGRVAFYVE
jgi:hypothetical protein